MKKPTPPTILLTTLLTASVIGNAYQYKAAEPAEELPINQPVTDEPEGEEPGEVYNPISGEESLVDIIWSTTATFAITYAVKEKAGPVSRVLIRNPLNYRLNIGGSIREMIFLYDIPNDDLRGTERGVWVTDDGKYRLVHLKDIEKL